MWEGGVVGAGSVPRVGLWGTAEPRHGVRGARAGPRQRSLGSSRGSGNTGSGSPGTGVGPGTGRSRLILDALLRQSGLVWLLQLLQASLPRGVPVGGPAPTGTPVPAGAARQAGDGREAGPAADILAAGSAGAGGGAGRSGASRPPSSGSAGSSGQQPSTQDMMRRLLDTQRLLVAVSRENDRLAGVNQRLAAGRQLVADDYKVTDHPCWGSSLWLGCMRVAALLPAGIVGVKERSGRAAAATFCGLCLT